MRPVIYARCAMIRILLAFIALITTAQAVAEESAPIKQKLDLSKAWFKPYLIKNNDAACEKLLQDAQDKFFSTVDFSDAYEFRSDNQNQTGKILNWEKVADPAKIEAHGKTFYLYFYTNNGCGGACETNQPVISEKPISKDRDYEYFRELVKDAPPAASYDYTITRNPEGRFYLFIVGTSGDYENQLLIYHLAPEGKWQSACQVALAPVNLEEKKDAIFSPAVNAIEQLEGATGGLSRSGGGMCGSMDTNWRWKGYLRSALYKVLSRPWALNVGIGKYDGGNSRGHYDISMQNLEKWQLMGISEHRAFLRYQDQLEQSIKDVSRFYQSQFSWAPEESTRVAELALKNAISRGFGFSGYEPFVSEVEPAWRKAIFDKATIEELQNLPVDKAMVNPEPDGAFGTPVESVLNVAVGYPEALNILLEKGLNPNAVNAFGKTPLMYAAQYNELESAKLLLDHGADPNAATTEPMDKCYYNLQTFNMTPLHYAVRYASPEFVKLLLERGAEPFIKARSDLNYPLKDATPLDWLHRYTAADAAEMNPNIPVDKVAALELLLRPPAAEELTAFASKSILQAEKDFQDGKVEPAFRLLKKVLNLQPENERALSDMSLVALKQGEIGASLEASRKLIETSKDDQLRANA